MLKVVQDLAEPNSVGESLLDEIVRDGARQMLAAALLAEVAGYVEAHAGEVDDRGRRLVVRNGYHQPREVTTAAGAVSVRQPRVNDKRADPVSGERRRFSSAILPAWSRKSPRVAEVLPLLYLHGLSSSDSGRRWSSSSAPTLACRRPRSPGSPPSGKTRRRRSVTGRWPAPTTCNCGSTASI
jgi:hypothetical protein